MDSPILLKYLYFEDESQDTGYAAKCFKNELFDSFESKAQSSGCWFAVLIIVLDVWHVLPLFKGILYLLICFVFTYNHWFYFVLLPIFAQTLMVRFIALGTRTSSTEKCNGTVIHVKIYTQHDSSLAPH